MNKLEKKNILIIGSSAKEFALAKRFVAYETVGKVYVASGNTSMKDFAECVDIREDKPEELLEFALENDIYLTIAASEKSIKANVAGLFQANSQLIFAPVAASAGFAISKSMGKKFMYKLHIPTPKFGVFEKELIALDYVRTSPMPILIGPDEVNEISVKAACASVSLSKTCVSELFLNNEPRILIEDWAYGACFTFYVVTDGYNVLPITAVRDYKFLEEGEGGLLTQGMGAFAPDYKISSELTNKLMNNVKSMLTSLEKRQTPYLGILGIEGVLTDTDRFITTGFTPFLKDHDAQLVLDILDENLLTLFEACAVGSFADDYESIKLKGNSGVSAVLYSRSAGKVISGLDKLDGNVEVTPFNVTKNEYLETLTNKGRTLVVTQTASTLTRAKNQLYENIDTVQFEGKKFRIDICD